MSYLDILKPQLVIDEGRKNKMYKDSRGIETIGIGHNLRDKPISDAAVNQIFEDDVADAEADARKLFPVFDQLTDARKAVVVNMSMNLGYTAFSFFTRTIVAINAGDYNDAATYMLASVWASQVGQRAQRLAEAMRQG